MEITDIKDKLTVIADNLREIGQDGSMLYRERKLAKSLQDLPEILNGIVDALENAPTMPDGFIVNVEDLHSGDIVSSERYGLIEYAPFLKWDGESWYARINAIPDEVRAYIAGGADVDEVAAVWGWCTYGVTEGTVEVDTMSVVAFAPVDSGYKFIYAEQ